MARSKLLKFLRVILPKNTENCKRYGHVFSAFFKIVDLTKSPGDNSTAKSHNNFGKGAVCLLTSVLRTALLYLVIITAVRLMGKRQVGELEPSELVVSLLIADLAVMPIQETSLPLWAGLVPIFTLIAITMLLSLLTMKCLPLRTLLCGRPSIVVRNGVPDQKEMRRNRYTVDELLEELRMKGCPDLAAVRYAILETNGQLSVLPYAAQQPPTAQDMGVNAYEGGLSVVLISDGTVLRDNLRRSGHDEDWLNRQLRTHHCPSPAHVFLMTVDEGGKVYVAAKEA